MYVIIRHMNGSDWYLTFSRSGDSYYTRSKVCATSFDSEAEAKEWASPEDKVLTTNP